MNYEQANSVKELAPEVMKVLEGLEWECSHCQGKGYVVTGPAIMDQYTCSLCEEGKIHYSWTPQVGEWVLWNGLALLISDVGHKDNSVIVGKVLIWKNEEVHWFYLAKITPILPWEEIGGVLEKVGYKLKIRETSEKELYKLHNQERGLAGTRLYGKNLLSQFGIKVKHKLTFQPRWDKRIEWLIINFNGGDNNERDKV